MSNLRGQADERFHAKRAWLEKVGSPLASESASFEHGFNAAWDRIKPDKFDNLRRAALNLVGVPSDDIGELVSMLGVLHMHSSDDDARVSLELLVALIETHPSKDGKP